MIGYREYLMTFLHRFSYSEEDTAYFLSVFDKLMKDSATKAKFSDFLSAYASDIDNYKNESYFPECKTMAERNEIPYESVEFLLLACLTLPLSEHYRKAGIGEDIYYGSVADLKYKNEECKCVRGYPGTFVSGWFDGFYRLNRFGLGRLQFETATFHDTATVSGILLTPDTQVINIHIPRTGTPLYHEDVEKSYRAAFEFYKDKFDSEPMVFKCESWLLYPKNYELLSEKSNIRHFMDDFDIIAYHEYPSYHDVWRLFDCDYDGNADKLPADTSFRRGYIDWIRRGVKTGYGIGVFVYRQ